MPGGKPGLVSFFAFAWDVPAGTVPVAYATNPAANEVTREIEVQFPRREQPKYRSRDLQLDDAFMQKVLDELDPNGLGDPASRILHRRTFFRRSSPNLASGPNEIGILKPNMNTPWMLRISGFPLNSSSDTTLFAQRRTTADVAPGLH